MCVLSCVGIRSHVCGNVCVSGSAVREVSTTLYVQNRTGLACTVYRMNVYEIFAPERGAGASVHAVTPLLL